MEQPPTPHDYDPGRSGYSLANVAELLFPCLDAAGVRSVAEVGAYRGQLTRALLEWARGSGAEISAIEPEPPPELLELASEHPELELIRETSHEALRQIALPDAVIVDSDHNYYTLSEELRLIDERCDGGELPLLLFHDVAWPHARRDTYYTPDAIPEEHRQPLARDVGLVPGNPGVVDSGSGLPYEWAAAREGGPRNGILTALEDFTGPREGLRLVTIPAFFGFGVVWRLDAPWAGAVAELVDPWDRHPVLERLEADRVAHLLAARDTAHQLERLRAEQRRLLKSMLGSRAFTLAERISRLNQRGRPVFTREQVKRVLGEDGG